MKQKLLQYKWGMILSSIGILLPSLFGLIFGEQLPKWIDENWNISNVASSMRSVISTAIYVPFLLLMIHWICIFVTFLDNKQQNQSRKAFGMIFWIMPLISIYSCGLLYAFAIGITFDIVTWSSILFGVVFIVIGNYMPKYKQNRTLGYKLVWTLANEDNWNKTHRLAGKVSVICGLLTFCCAFLPTKIAITIFIALVLVNVLVPCAYSYHIYRKHVAQGIVYTFGEKRKKNLFVSLLLTVIALSACAVFMMTGDVHATANKDTLSIEASYWPDKEIPFDKIDSVTLVENFDIGSKINGFGSPRLCVGIFKNDTHGTYTCYSYTKRDVTIVLTAYGEIYAIGLESDTETQALYETLAKEIG